MSSSDTQAAAPVGGAESEEHKSAASRRLIGRVRSDKMTNTVVVEVVRYKMDPVYKKYVRVRKRYKVHDRDNQYRQGDRVEIEEHRPISKGKRWTVTRLIERPALVGTAGGAEAR